MLLAVTVALPSQSSIAADEGAAEAFLSGPDYVTPFGPLGKFPVDDRAPRSIERMGRRTASFPVRVRASQGTFIGNIAEVRDAGLVSLAPGSRRTWSGPVELLAWDDIRTIEVRRHSPLRTAACGVGVGAVLGVIGGGVWAHENGNDELMGGFLIGLAGTLVGGPIGLAYGIAFPIWEPLYHAP